MLVLITNVVPTEGKLNMGADGRVKSIRRCSARRWTASSPKSPNTQLTPHFEARTDDKRTDIKRRQRQLGNGFDVELAGAVSAIERHKLSATMAEARGVSCHR